LQLANGLIEAAIRTINFIAKGPNSSAFTARPSTPNWLMIKWLPPNDKPATMRQYKYLSSMLQIAKCHAPPTI
jgi:hypothetical protein